MFVVCCLDLFELQGTVVGLCSCCLFCLWLFVVFDSLWLLIWLGWYEMFLVRGLCFTDLYVLLLLCLFACIDCDLGVNSIVSIFNFYLL